MAKQLKIWNYKCLETEDLSLEKLTILTGVNSSGKSSVIQCILLLAHYFGKMKFLGEGVRDFSLIKNRYLNAKELRISLDTISVTLAQNKDGNSFEGHESEFEPTIDKNWETDQ